MIQTKKNRLKIRQVKKWSQKKQITNKNKIQKRLKILWVMKQKQRSLPTNQKRAKKRRKSKRLSMKQLRKTKL